MIDVYETIKSVVCFDYSVKFAKCIVFCSECLDFRLLHATYMSGGICSSFAVVR